MAVDAVAVQDGEHVDVVCTRVLSDEEVVLVRFARVLTGEALLGVDGVPDGGDGFVRLGSSALDFDWSLERLPRPVDLGRGESLRVERPAPLDLWDDSLLLTFVELLDELVQFVHVGLLFLRFRSLDRVLKLQKFLFSGSVRL